MCRNVNLEGIAITKSIKYNAKNKERMENEIKNIIREFANPREETLDNAVKRICALFNVSQQRELLLAWEEYCCKLEYITPNYEVIDEDINDFLANYCG